MSQVLNKRTMNIPADTVYIDRGSRWGNPFRIWIDGDRETVLLQHEPWLREQHHLLRAMGELRGRDLTYFCVPQGCHGDLYHRLANGTRDEMIRWWRGQAG